VKSVLIPSDPDSARKVQKDILGAITEQNYKDSVVFAIRLALEESLINAIKHGNCCDPGKKVKIDYNIAPDRIELTITDEGEGFYPECLPNPTSEENLEKPCGRGVMLIKAYMDHVEYNDRGNQIRMVKENK